MSRTPPLQGCRVLITRPRPAAEGLAAQLAALGAIPVLLPAIEIRPPEDPRPLEEAVRQALTFDWILFTSANGVHAFLERWIAAGRSPAELARVRLGAIGPATARALQRYGLQAAYQPAVYLSEAMAEGLGEVAGRRVLLPRADIARRELAERLRARGAEVVEVAAYRVAAAGDAEALRTALDPRPHRVTFTSPSTVGALAGLLEQREEIRPADLPAVCIGPVTAAEAAALGFPIAAVAREHTQEGLIRALIESWGRNPSSSPEG
ncbi:uroporphyrinogen-III synthase [Thermoflexus sp.]|jgi:uroporphyrinogen III methyltransferase/synthase|uniref:uroporphyrinogen-III synthase n=1 Tax=Thermoflexus sp. TaxID=1969742 RepID=UPI00262E278D|nr:uroporphyrinogen-III synthase [Thermoflexus sp.]